jgi:hypothetical protein
MRGDPPERLAETSNGVPGAARRDGHTMASMATLAEHPAACVQRALADGGENLPRAYIFPHANSACDGDFRRQTAAVFLGIASAAPRVFPVLD